MYFYVTPGSNPVYLNFYTYQYFSRLYVNDFDFNDHLPMGMLLKFQYLGPMRICFWECCDSKILIKNLLFQNIYKESNSGNVLVPKYL